MNDRYKSKSFKKFAQKLKREKLWGKFRILEYYFELCDQRKGNSKEKIYEALNNPSKFSVANNRGYKIFGEGSIKLSEVFDYYRV